MNEIIIRSSVRNKIVDLPEIWKYRELFIILAWRDIKVRYKQTVIGVLWVVFQPLVTMFIFTLFFGRLGNINTGVLPYSLSVLMGLVVWGYFSSVVTHASDSLISNESLLKKVYFPRLILPMSTVISNILDFFIATILMLVASFIFGFPPNFIILMLILPITILITVATALGLGLFMSALNVKYRDVRYILPFFIQLILFLTPVIYPLSALSEVNRYILAINPLTLAIELMRYSFTGQFNENILLVFMSLLSSVLIFILGVWYFNRTEKFFADIV